MIDSRFVYNQESIVAFLVDVHFDWRILLTVFFYI